jgi:hypothetical protein
MSLQDIIEIIEQEDTQEEYAAINAEEELSFT